MFWRLNSPAPLGKALPEKTETPCGWHEDQIQMKLARKLPDIANAFDSGSPADSDTNELSSSSLDELETYIHDLLQTHRSNQDVPFLFDPASALHSHEPLGLSREQVVDSEDHFLLDRQLSHGFRNLVDPFGEQVTLDDLLAMPIPTNPQQDAVRRWLEHVMPLTPAPTPLRSPEPIFDATFSSFLLSPSVLGTADPGSTTSEDCESETSPKSPFEYDAGQRLHANYSQGYGPHSHFGEPAHVHCHSHEGIFHGDPNCTCNCGSHCEFLRRNSKRRRCECDCPCHTCTQPHEHTLGKPPQDLPCRDPLDDHFESLDLAERGAFFHPAGSGISYHTAPERQELESGYFEGVVQYQADAVFHFPSSDSQIRLQPNEVDEPFLVWSDEDGDEEILDLGEGDW